MKVVKKKQQEKPKKKGIKKAILSTFALIMAFLTSSFVILGFASPKRLSTSRNISEVYTTVESSGGTYFGPVENMTYSGAGEFHYLKGGVYEGEFENSTRSGQGTFMWDDGDVFSGKWTGDNMVSGIYTWANGDRVDGSWENNILTKGTYTFSDGAQFVGSFVNGSLDSGTLTLSTDETSEFASYSVTYDRGRITKANIVDRDGNTFEGDLSGQAKMKYANGDTYEGAVKNGVRNGSGTYTWYDSEGKVAAKYVGAWTDGVMGGGIGTYYYSASAYPYLTGTFEGGKPSGVAIYYKEAGNTFDTTWTKGKCTKVVET